MDQKSGTNGLANVVDTVAYLLPLALLGIQLLVSGCTTTLKVAQVERQQVEPLAGWNYSLPFVSYEITIVRTLLKCSANGVTVAVAVTADNPLFEPDPSQSYVVDYTSLSNWAKTSKLELTRDSNGMLTKVGATSEDKTGKIVENTVAGVVKLAATAAILAGGGAEEVGTVCDPAIEEKTRKVPTLTTRVEASTKKLKAASDELAFLKSYLPGEDLGATRGRIFDQARVVFRSERELEEADAALIEVKTPLTDVQRLRWPTNGRLLSHIDELSPATRSRWFRAVDVDQSIRVTLRIVDVFGAGVPTDESSSELPAQTSAKTSDGIRYRSPVRGALEMRGCTRYNDSGECADSDKTHAVVVEGSFPQLGRVFILPFKNGVFQNNELSTTFSEDGGWTAASYEEKSSRGEVASESFKNAATSLREGITDVLTAGPAAQLKQLQDETSILEQKKSLKTARDALAPPTTEEQAKQQAIVDADTALINAQKAKATAELELLNARAALAAARKPQPSPKP